MGPDGPFNAAERTYTFLRGGQEISGLERVPSVFREPEFFDCSHVPAKTNFSGAAQLYQKKTPGIPGWTCVWFPKQNFIFYTLKDTEKQPVTHLWMEFGGRFQHPWDGRTHAVAIEDMQPEFPAAMRERMKEHIAGMEKLGVAADRAFDGTPFELRYIEGAVSVPENFGKVRNIRFEENGIVFESGSGNECGASVNWKFCLGS